MLHSHYLQPVFNRLQRRKYRDQCTVLGSSTGWVIKSLISSKWVSNLSYTRLRVLKGQILCLGQFLGRIWAIFGLKRPKTGPKKNFKIVDFLLLFVTIVIRCFNTYNRCISFIYRFYQLPGIFKFKFYTWTYF